MIISVHMPKSGGTSFRHLLKDRFSKTIFEDYDFPIHDTEQQRHQKARRQKMWNTFLGRFFRFRKIECIHGHFLPFKYEYFYESGNHTFVTWLRDPLERLESHYYYWKQNQGRLDPLPLLQKFIKEDWSLEEFAFCEEVRNIYSLFLWNFPVERFDFIGITEFFDEDVDYFARNYLNISGIDIPEENINPNKKKERIKDSGFIREFKQFHARDYGMYRFALEQRDKR